MKNSSPVTLTQRLLLTVVVYVDSAAVVYQINQHMDELDHRLVNLVEARGKSDSHTSDQI